MTNEETTADLAFEMITDGLSAGEPKREEYEARDAGNGTFLVGGDVWFGIDARDTKLLYQQSRIVELTKALEKARDELLARATAEPEPQSEDDDDDQDGLGTIRQDIRFRMAGESITLESKHAWEKLVLSAPHSGMRSALVKGSQNLADGLRDLVMAMDGDAAGNDTDEEDKTDE